MNRRHAFHALIAGAGAGLSGAAAGETEPASESVAASAAAFQGRRYTTAQVAQIARRWRGLLPELDRLRAAGLSPGAEPAFTFDPLLPGHRTAEGPPVINLKLPRPGRRPADPAAVAQAPVWRLAGWIRSGELTSVELTRLYLDRIRRYGPRLLAVVSMFEQEALASAAERDRELREGRYRGPLHGIPWGAKDILAVRGRPTTWGARIWENREFDFNATVVERLENAGAILLVKLSTGELALGDRWFRGRTRNPWKPEQGSSGSSAGPGSAAAASLVGFTIGSETLGSIVAPSVRNGVTGLRPTYGRVPRTGAMVLAWTMDKLGPICRSVLDCGLVLAEIAGPDGIDPAASQSAVHLNSTGSLRGLKAGIDQASLESQKPGSPVRAAVERAIAELERAGVQTSIFRYPEPRDVYQRLSRVILPVESGASFAESLENDHLIDLVDQGDGGWPNTFRTASMVSALDYIRAMQWRRRLQTEMDAALKPFDFVIGAPMSSHALLYTNMTGYPSLVLRAGMDDGLPLSLELIGPLFGESILLRAGRFLESRLPGQGVWPDLEKLPSEPPPEPAG